MTNSKQNSSVVSKGDFLFPAHGNITKTGFPLYTFSGKSSRNYLDYAQLFSPYMAVVPTPDRRNNLDTNVSLSGCLLKRYTFHLLTTTELMLNI